MTGAQTYSQNESWNSIALRKSRISSTPGKNGYFENAKHLKLCAQFGIVHVSDGIVTWSTMQWSKVKEEKEMWRGFSDAVWNMSASRLLQSSVEWMKSRSKIPLIREKWWKPLSSPTFWPLRTDVYLRCIFSSFKNIIYLFANPSLALWRNP